MDIAQPDDSDAALLARVNEVLDRKANPSIAKHRGAVNAESVEDGIVFLRMSGGCQGCASAAMTLRHGVEEILRKDIPEIRDIVDVTDHATGENPFYTGTPGAVPSFTRLIPAERIGWEDGQLAIDPEYLAPCLGLTPEQLQDGLAGGVVTIETKPSGSRTRVVVRGPLRSWAADVLPDGTAREVPPPRPPSAAEQAQNTLPRRIREHLEAQPASQLPVTYGQIARAMGLYAPGSRRKVTAALETTMREDAAANRPFIAARAVSRRKLPHKRFFAFAAATGRGAQAGESQADWHQRLLAASLSG
ncbi:NifU family protein [Pararhodobacter oceanensis]|uniref:NifU family protein n=1 Tax=Pararhodobacter oceanensis TaxID=2172121 RepID=UPI003A92BA00